VKPILAIVEKLIEQPAILILVLGAVFFLLGAAGGVQYSGWLPIQDDQGRYTAIGGGIVLLLAGLLLTLGKGKSKLPTAKSFAAKIIEPEKGPSADKVKVRGVINRLPPEGYKLMLLRFYADSKYTPMKVEVKFRQEDSKYEWYANDCVVGGKPGERRTIAAYLVGKSGQALFQYHEDAVTFYMTQQTDPNRFMPAIKLPTEDMISLAEVELIKQ
jgi:hypothetical protein